MIRALGLLTAFILALPLAARAEDYTIDPAHSSATFSVKHMMVSTVHGSFSGVTGTIHYDRNNPSQSSVNAEIDATTVNTDNAKRDGHLKSPDFFDVAKYPKITFTSTSVKSEGEGKLKVTGNLTMHGVTKEVVLDVDGPAPDTKDPWGNVRTGLTATTKVNRKDFGLNWNKALEAGGVLVGDDVKIELDIEGSKAK